jgi:hypothetical protein
MTDRKIFGLAVRLAGLYAALYIGILNVYSGFGCFLNPSGKHGDSVPYFVMGCLALVTGFLLINGEWLVRFAYGRESTDPSSSRVIPPDPAN